MQTENAEEKEKRGEKGGERPPKRGFRGNHRSPEETPGKLSKLDWKKVDSRKKKNKKGRRLLALFRRF